MNPVDFQVRPTEALSSHHYLCSCTQELWVLLMHLVQHRNKVLHTRVTQLRSLIRSLLRALRDPLPVLMRRHLSSLSGAT